jgi:hypothetical protein
LHDGVKCEVVFPTPLPDDPQKWDGWNKYKSTNPYERLCLDAEENPTNELIEEHCRELLRWWQKKLPLKNQPSNPVAQLLRAGLDESSRYLTEARMELLDPERRKKVDAVLAAEAEQQAIAEFNKVLSFSIADGGLRPEEEKALQRFGAEHGLSEEKVLEFIEAKLKETGTTRIVPEPEVKVETMVAVAPGDTKSEFLRVLQLSGLDGESMTDDQRDALINIAENSGLDPGMPRTWWMNTLKKSTGNKSPISPRLRQNPQPRLVGMERVRGRGRPRSRWWKSRFRSLLPNARSFRPNRNGNDIPITAIRSADRCFLFHQENSSWVIRFQMHLQTKHRISALLSPVFTCRAFR